MPKTANYIPKKIRIRSFIVFKKQVIRFEIPSFYTLIKSILNKKRNFEEGNANYLPEVNTRLTQKLRGRTVIFIVHLNIQCLNFTFGPVSSA